MHTAICTFEDRATAEQAVERLLQAGYARHDVHLEHRYADGTPMPDEHGTDVVGKFSFFERLFGAGKHAPHARTYAGAVDRGLYVVLVEAPTEEGAQRAQDVLHGLNPDDLNLVHRAGEPPLRDVVAERQAGADLQRAFGSAREEMGADHNRTDEREGLFPPERAMASQGWGEQRTLRVAGESPQQAGDGDDGGGPGRPDREKPNR